MTPGPQRPTKKAAQRGEQYDFIAQLDKEARQRLLKEILLLMWHHYSPKREDGWWECLGTEDFAPFWQRPELRGWSLATPRQRARQTISALRQCKDEISPADRAKYDLPNRGFGRSGYRTFTSYAALARELHGAMTTLLPGFQSEILYQTGPILPKPNHLAAVEELTARELLPGGPIEPTIKTRRYDLPAELWVRYQALAKDTARDDILPFEAIIEAYLDTQPDAPPPGTKQRVRVLADARTVTPSTIVKAALERYLAERG